MAEGDKAVSPILVANTFLEQYPAVKEAMDDLGLSMQDLSDAGTSLAGEALAQAIEAENRFGESSSMVADYVRSLTGDINAPVALVFSVSKDKSSLSISESNLSLISANFNWSSFAISSLSTTITESHGHALNL